jgi:hypothetical protein
VVGYTRPGSNPGFGTIYHQIICKRLFYQAQEKLISRVLFRAAVTRERDDNHSSGTQVALRL